MSRMTIGEAADAVGISTKAIRLWEARGLLPDIERTPAGYRLFGENELAVLRFVRQAQVLGMTLGEIKRILELQQAGTALCGHVTQRLDERIAAIDRTMGDLAQLRQTLILARQRTADDGEGGWNEGVCPIIEGTTP